MTQIPTGESPSTDADIPDPTTVVRTLRCLDGLFYSSIALAFMVFLPRTGIGGWVGLSMTLAIPVFAYSWFCLGIPVDLLGREQFKVSVSKLRIASLAFAGLAPAFIWWSRDVDHIYFLVNAVLCGVAGSATMFFVAEICYEICRALGTDRLGWEAKLTRLLVFWLHVIVIWCSGVVLVAGGCLIKGLSVHTVVLHLVGVSSENSVMGNIAVVSILRIGFAVAALSPISFFLSLVFRMRIILGNYLRLMRCEEKETAK